MNVNEDHEVRYWTQALGVSEEKLCEAVAAVGASADTGASTLGKPSKPICYPARAEVGPPIEPFPGPDPAEAPWFCRGTRG